MGPEIVDFDFCIIASGCNFGPFHKWGESLWFPTIHEAARAEGSWPQFDERFIEGRRRHILDEFNAVKGYARDKNRFVWWELASLVWNGSPRFSISSQTASSQSSTFCRIALALYPKRLQTIARHTWRKRAFNSSTIRSMTPRATISGQALASRGAAVLTRSTSALA